MNNQTEHRNLSQKSDTALGRYYDLTEGLSDVGNLAHDKEGLGGSGFLGLVKQVELPTGSANLLIKAVPGQSGMDRGRMSVTLVDASSGKLGEEGIRGAVGATYLRTQGTKVIPVERAADLADNSRVSEAFNQLLGETKTGQPLSSEQLATLGDLAIDADHYAVQGPDSKIDVRPLDELYPR